MSREVRNRFSVTGVAHILAVSGFHVAIVCGFLSFLFSFLSRNGCCRWIRYISLLVLLWVVAITGLAASFCEGSVDAYNVSDGRSVG